MGYYGNQPATGENNSFRVLDDLSSYTLTFDGSSAGDSITPSIRITSSGSSTNTVDSGVESQNDTFFDIYRVG